MAKQRSPDRGTDQDVSPDAKDFRAAVRDVKPLAQTPLAKGLAKPKPRPRLRKPAAASISENLDEVMPLISTPLLDTTDALASDTAITGGAVLTFQRAGVRTQVMRRLRRGLHPIEGELDLHGLSQTAARDQLADFIVRSRDAGCRCVRIIHGKGYRSGARGPVLKTAVDLWLRRHMDVIAFTSARMIDGGTGALYVLLRA
jgi:DNA-nicking Smr family endonuclease